jgi:hypothetical protein
LPCVLLATYILVHDHIIVIVSNHLGLLTLSHNHTGWVVWICSTVILLSDNELLLLYLLVQATHV